MILIYWVFFVPFLYVVGSITDFYFFCSDLVQKKLKIGYYRKRTPKELAEDVITMSMIRARMIRNLREIQKFL